MPSLLTAARYRVITLDTTSGDAVVTAALETAEDTVEEYLRRPLPSASREETVRFSPDGRLYPAATPILAAPDGVTVVPGGQALIGVTPDGSPLSWPAPGDSTYPAAATITYTGGYTAATLPRTIEAAIAWHAYQLLHLGDMAAVPAGVTSASVGDVSLGWAAPTGPGTDLGVAAMRSLRPYRRRFV